MKNSHNPVRSVERALSILKCFSFDKPQMQLSEIVESVKLPKTTIIRLVASLHDQAFLQRDQATQEYSLGMALFQLGKVAESKLRLREVSRPVMEELSMLTQETIEINIVMEGSRLCIDKIDSSHTLRYSATIGKRLPLYSAASGKLLLAYMNREDAHKIIKDNLGELDQTMIEINKQLDEIIKKGFAVSHGERIPGASTVSAPIRRWDGTVVAGLTISGATIRFTPERVNQFVDLILKATGDISRSLGYKDGNK